MTNGKKLTVKVTLIGDGAVGKTSIAQRYLQKGYKEKYLKTIGADFYEQTRRYTLSIGTVTFQWYIWDLSGEPSFDEVRTPYYNGAKAAILVYDISRSETAHNLSSWVREFQAHTSQIRPLVLVGNKVDLRGTEREEVSKELGERYAKKLTEFMEKGIEIPYLETSAKENTNIERIFEKLGELLVKWAKCTSSN